MNKVYVMTMTSIYYDGDDYVLDSISTDVRVYSSFSAAKNAMESAINEELSKGWGYTIEREADWFVRFYESTVEIEGKRVVYELEITEREIKEA